MQRFKDQIVVITGASSGIGRELARGFSREGASVVLAARSVDALEQLALELRAAGGQALVVPTDVRDYGQIERLIRVTQETFGRLDVLVNNAGQGLGVWAKDLTMAPVEDLFRTNVLALIYATRLALPGMITRRRGLIINISSVAGKVGTPSDSVYAASKFAVNGFAQGLRAILRRSKGGDERSELLRFGRLEIDLGGREVRLDGDVCALTSYQFDLLLALARHAGRVMSRETIMDQMKNERLDAFDRSIDVHISRIRAAIEDDPKKPRRVITVRGAGYVFAKAQD